MNFKINLLVLLPLLAYAISVARIDQQLEKTPETDHKRGLEKLMNKNRLNDDAYGKTWKAESFVESGIITRRRDFRKIRGCIKKKNGLYRNPSAPEFKDQGMPELVGANQGHRVELNCAYKATCPKPKVKWFKDGQLLEERDKSSGYSTIIINKNKGSLVVMDNREVDDGNYTCVIKNMYGNISHSFRVQSEGRMMAAKPQILPNQPGNHTVLVGSNLTLLCQTTYKGAEATAEIKWFKHYMVGGALKNKEGDPYTNLLQGSNDSPPPIDDQKLELFNLMEEDTGFYTCVVKNVYGLTGSTGYVEVLREFEDSDDVINERSKTKTIVILASSIGTVVGGILLIFALLWFCKFRRERKKKMLAIENARTVAAWTKKVMIERQTSGTESLLAPIVRIEKERINRTTWRNNEDSNTTLSEYEFQLDCDWEFPRELLDTCEELGEGAFGKVVRGLAHCSARSEDDTGRLVITSDAVEPLTVAVKMLKEGHTDSDMIDLVKEMEMMKVIGTHVNIINLLGVCTQPQGRPLYVIVEFAPHGNLRDYLRARRPETIQYLKTRKLGQEKPNPGEPQPISLKDMLSFGWQVGRGMQFLSQRRCVHRDLAARNVLVADQGVVKIADFGMARDLHDSDYYRKVGEGKLPVKWMSPESLFQRVCTTQSDVWSFGILLWEIVTWGDSPYKTVASLDALLELLKAGCRMSKPPGCPSDVYSVMSRCWSYQPELRPTWSSLVSELHVQYLQTRPGEYLELTPPTLNTPPSSPETSTLGFGITRMPSPQPYASYAFHHPTNCSPLNLDNNTFDGTIPSYTMTATDSVQPNEAHSYVTVPSPRHQQPSAGVTPSPRHNHQPPPSPRHSHQPHTAVTPPVTPFQRLPLSSLATPPPVDNVARLTLGRGFEPRDVGFDSPPDSIPDTGPSSVNPRVSYTGSLSSREGNDQSDANLHHGYGYSKDLSVMRCQGGDRDCGYANCLSEHSGTELKDEKGSRVVLAVDTDPVWVGFNKYVDTGQNRADTDYGYSGKSGGSFRQRGSSESGYGTAVESVSALSGRLPSESDSVFETEQDFSKRRPSLLNNNYVKTGTEALQPLLKRL